MQNDFIEIAGRKIGQCHSTFIVAEISANHNHDFDLAVETIKAIKEAGADAVKLQTYTADTLTIDCNNDYFKMKKGTIWYGKTLYELYQLAHTPWDWQPKLKQIAEDLDLICFSTPFDNTAVDFLEEMNVPAYKIASFEITDIPLVEYIASKGKPVIISTGIAKLEDIEEAINACRKVNNNIALLKCSSAYPAPIEEANLLTIPNMKQKFGTVVGLSDHTLGSFVAITAVALGANIIEKHFILDRKIGSPDASFSMEPNEFKYMVNTIRDVEKALGKVDYTLSDRVKNNRLLARSLFVVRDIKKGEIFTGDNIRSIRPGYGLQPKYFKNIFGKQAKKDIKKGAPMSWELVG